jgi:5-methylthioadenosine/S-adenosylhomocysteine deaminase
MKLAIEISERPLQIRRAPDRPTGKTGSVGSQFHCGPCRSSGRAEIALLAQLGCSVAHCPSSNLKLASGISPVDKMLAAGINVGMGTDGAASNNRLDVFCEMRLAALLAKATSDDAETVPAHSALRMATLNAAQALGLEQTIGSIEPGKSADLCAVNLDSLDLAPCYDPASHLVYAAGREHVSDVWVAGRQLVDLASSCTWTRRKSAQGRRVAIAYPRHNVERKAAWK